VRKAVAAFETDLGWRVEQVETPWGPRGPELARFFWPAHFTRHADRVPELRDKMDPGFVACIEAGLHITMADYQKKRLAKYAYCAEIHHFFEDWDFLLTPAVSVAAFPAEQLQTGPLAATSVGLDVVGGVLLPVQHVAESGSFNSLRVYRRRSPGWASDRRPALRRPRGAADVGGVRGGTPMGFATSANCLRNIAASVDAYAGVGRWMRAAPAAVQ